MRRRERLVAVTPRVGNFGVPHSFRSRPPPLGGLTHPLSLARPALDQSALWTCSLAENVRLLIHHCKGCDQEPQIPGCPSISKGRSGYPHSVGSMEPALSGRKTDPGPDWGPRPWELS